MADNGQPNLGAMTRAELDAYAIAHGVADPASYPNKEALIAALGPGQDADLDADADDEGEDATAPVPAPAAKRRPRTAGTITVDHTGKRVG